MSTSEDSWSKNLTDSQKCTLRGQWPSWRVLKAETSVCQCRTNSHAHSKVSWSWNIPAPLWPPCKCLKIHIYRTTLTVELTFIKGQGTLQYAWRLKPQYVNLRALLSPLTLDQVTKNIWRSLCNIYWTGSVSWTKQKWLTTMTQCCITATFSKNNLFI